MINDMKTTMYIAMLALFFSLFSCEEEEPISGATYNKTCITGYVVPEYFSTGKVDSGMKFALRGNVITSGDAFKRLSQKYNDVSYNRYTVHGPCQALEDGLCKMKVETIKPFDATHPVGSDISDLIECRYISFYDYVLSGYQEEEKAWEQYLDLTEYCNFEGAKLMMVNLRSLNYNNTQLMGTDFVLTFKKEPEEKGVYRFILTLQTQDKEINKVFEYEF